MLQRMQLEAVTDLYTVFHTQARWTKLDDLKIGGPPARVEGLAGHVWQILQAWENLEAATHNAENIRTTGATQEEMDAVLGMNDLDTLWNTFLQRRTFPGDLYRMIGDSSFCHGFIWRYKSVSSRSTTR